MGSENLRKIVAGNYNLKETNLNIFSDLEIEFFLYCGKEEIEVFSNGSDFPRIVFGSRYLIKDFSKLVGINSDYWIKAGKLYLGLDKFREYLNKKLEFKI